MATVEEPSGPVQRATLCVAGSEAGIALHGVDVGFSNVIKKHYSNRESTAIEELLQLKEELKNADTETFWARLMDGFTAICNAEYGFVAKRILRDDHDSNVEMPPLGAAGSCLLGTAFYFNDRKNTKAMLRDYKYHADGAPCGYMKHDKVFLIPGSMNDFITDNPNKLPFPADAYLGVPLFSDGKCFAHFGAMWTKEGLEQRHLSWAAVELIMHSLEDMILERLLTGESFAKAELTITTAKNEKKKVIPQEAITASQSLKPYARSLSHELRTPMQGVVGMLDVMHATVQEALEGHKHPRVQDVFHALRENIEAVQDSSRRAVEAADNVVHAYDMDMHVPETPQDGEDGEGSSAKATSADVPEARPSIFIEGHNIASNPYKRRRNSPISWQGGSSPKLRHRIPSDDLVSPGTEEIGPLGGVEEPYSPVEQSNGATSSPTRSRHDTRTPNGRLPNDRDFLSSGNKQSKIREILRFVVNDGLLVGGRPDSAITHETDLGEKLDVRSRSSNGDSSAKSIEWSVEEDVPDTLPVDERDFSKLISCVFLNAIKFTESGSITITARVPDSGSCVLVKVVDTGMGIPQDFLPQLFKAFSREDDSTTRSKEGLGLGLLVAKGLARKIGGDIQCVRSETSGPNHGTEFDIRIPLTGESFSRANSPFNGTPTAQRVSAQTLGNRQSLSPVHSHKEIPRNGEPTSHPADQSATSSRRMSTSNSRMRPPVTPSFDRRLAEKHPLTFLVAEDNKINRKLLVTMLSKLGYKDVYEAFDGREAVRIMRDVYDSAGRVHSPVKRTSSRAVKPGSVARKPVDIILMDLWMPEMDGYEATEKILEMAENHAKGNPMLNGNFRPPTVMAVTADVTDEALLRATQTGMEGYMTKPYKLNDLQRLIEELGLRQLDKHSQQG